MRRQPSRFANLSLIHFWRQRLIHLSLALEQHPHSNNAWFWAMQRRVTHYLLARYDSLPVKAPAEETAPLLQDAAALPPGPAAMFYSNPSANADSNAPPRASTLMRPVIAKITTLNELRYSCVQSEREEERVIRRCEEAIARVAAGEYARYRPALSNDEINYLATLLSDGDNAEWV